MTNDELHKLMIRTFGLTKNWNDAVFILPDGRLIAYASTHEDMADELEVTLDDLLATGVVRVQPGMGRQVSLEFGVPATEAQAVTIARQARAYDQSVFVGRSGHEHRSVGVDLPASDVRADRILAITQRIFALPVGLGSLMFQPVVDTRDQLLRVMDGWIDRGERVAARFVRQPLTHKAMVALTKRMSATRNRLAKHTLTASDEVLIVEALSDHARPTRRLITGLQSELGLRRRR